MEAVVSQAIKLPQLPEQGRIAGSFPIFLQLSMVVFEAMDAPISRIEVNRARSCEVQSQTASFFTFRIRDLNGYLGLSPISRQFSFTPINHFDSFFALKKYYSHAAINASRLI
jgi:hypothetical protein